MEEIHAEGRTWEWVKESEVGEGSQRERDGERGKEREWEGETNRARMNGWNIKQMHIPTNKHSH